MQVGFYRPVSFKKTYMRRETFERLKKLGINFDDEFEGLLVKPLENLRNKNEEVKLQKVLSIKYLSSSIDDLNINLTFEISAKNLKTGNATIYVQEMNANNEDVVPLTNVVINQKGKKIITASFDKKKKFDYYFWQDGPKYQATISCDNLSSKTDEFSLKIIKVNEDSECKKEKVPALNLTDEQKGKFIATVLCETQLGNDVLYDIAWVYYNRVRIKGFDHKAGLKASTAFRYKQPDYKLCSYYLNVGKEYANVKYGDFTIKSYTETNEFKEKKEPKFIKLKKFIETNVFSKNPETCFKDWIGQGYWGDLDLNPDDSNNESQDPKWYQARQYYWLQLEKKVSVKYVHIMRTGIGTSFIFDEVSIAKFFKTNPKLLPDADKVKKFRNKDGILNFDL